ncbi:hypothetical protein Gasu2_25080 [Galdieria sulphuraria]|uniref:Uncharacterized protein n=1 Tax=Galdieria sulphuraria TaxID=130081 RepID=M2X399_GALSU|nr:hypothetical protein Gasu_18710 isoform 2 [Galdieria sulphuraria]EME30855.1 hypothetical protein isoform 2 [Galdieria sulphuraria]GJD08203.1 hypothetical protein Gasu2_25080 [Galdieria sulphuraria]|eukprot:XP_005707375.1 hypothetical protein isoform 2 [Galdieria sulphuraria]
MASFTDKPSDTQLDELEEGLEAELAAAEARLADSRNRPFGERGPELLEQVERLRRKQFEVYIDQAELERRFPFPSKKFSSSGEKEDLSFGTFAESLREREVATDRILQKITDLDVELRSVLTKVRQNAGETFSSLSSS